MSTKKIDAKKSQSSNFKIPDFFENHSGFIIKFCLIVLPVAVYWQVTSFEFVWDDMDFYFWEHIFTDPTWSKWINTWIAPYKNSYMPAVGTYWMILITIGRMIGTGGEQYNLAVLHFGNVILHIINTFLVYRLLQTILEAYQKDRYALKWAIFLATLLFLMHPIQVQSVSWISEQRGMLSILLGLSALNLYLAACKIETSSRKTFYIYYFAAFIMFNLSFTSKPTAASIPLIAGLLDIFLFKRSIWKAAARVLPWFIIVVPLSATVLQRMGTEVSTAVWTRPFVWMYSINFYLSKIIWPVPLAVSYGKIPQLLVTEWWFYVQWVIPPAILYLLWRIRKKHIVLGISFLIFVIGYLPVSGLVPFAHQLWTTVADRYIYLSMTGVSLAAAYLLSVYRYRSVWLLSIIIIIVFTIRSYSTQIPIWKNDFTLWDHCIKVIPGDPRTYYNRGGYHYNQKNYEKALENYNKVTDLAPFLVKVYIKKGNIYARQKKFDMAMKQYSKAVENDPESISGHFNKANIHMEFDQYDKAIEEYNKALSLTPRNKYMVKIDYTVVWRGRGLAFKQVKEYDRAIADFNRALKINSKDEVSYILRGAVYQEMGQYDKALEDYNMVLKINPKNQNIRMKREVLLRKMR